MGLIRIVGFAVPRSRVTVSRAPQALTYRKAYLPAAMVPVYPHKINVEPFVAILECGMLTEHSFGNSR